MTPEEIATFKSQMWSNNFQTLNSMRKEHEQKAALILEVMDSKTKAAQCKGINTFKGKTNPFN